MIQEVKDFSHAALEDAMKNDRGDVRMVLRALGRRSFFFFTKVQVGYYFRPNKFSSETFKERQDFVQSAVCKEKRLLIEDPRGCGKSWGITVSLPPWIATLRPHPYHPTGCALCEKYGMLDHPNEVTRADKFLMDNPHLKGVDSRLVIFSDSVKRGYKWVGTVKTLMETSPIIQWTYPEVVWVDTHEAKSWSREEIYLPGRTNPGLTDGFLRAAGMESKEQGGRAEGVFIEDIVGEQSYRSATELEARRDALDLTPQLLENNDYGHPEGGFIIVGGNRWCNGDVNSKIHEELPHYAIWHRASFRCYVHGAGNCGRRRYDVADGERTEQDVQAEQCAPTDEPLWKERYPDAASLARVRADRGEAVWWAQWMNAPLEVGELDARKIVPFLLEDVTSEEGVSELCAVFGSRDGRPEVIPVASLAQHLITIDPASSTDPRACRTAIVWEGFHPRTRRRLVLELRADRYDPSTVLDQVVQLYVKAVQLTKRVPRILCEKVAAQDYVAAGLVIAGRELRREQGLGMPQVEMIPVPRNVRKEDRNRRRVGALIDQGLLCVRLGINLIAHEVRHFPTGTMDTLDAISQGEEVYQGAMVTDTEDRLAVARARRRRRRIVRSTSTGAPLYD